MKNLFCIIILYIFCQYVENSDGFENSSHGDINGGEDFNNDQLRSKDRNQDIIRPCSFNDLNCIRGIFAHHLQCMVPQGPVPNSYVLQLLPNIHVPHANLTFELVTAQIKGLDKFKIEEFYINKATDTIVLEVVIDKIVVTSPESRLRYYRKGKEALEVSDFSVIAYDDLSFTLTITNINGLQSSRSNVYTYINDVFPKFTLGPGTYSSKDPGFIRAIAELQTKLNLSLKEVFVTQGPVFFSAFFKRNICSLE